MQYFLKYVHLQKLLDARLTWTWKKLVIERERYEKFDRAKRTEVEREL